MTNLSEAVRAKVSEECLTTKCQKKGCRVRLPIRNRRFILIDMDHSKSPAPQDGVRCDFLFIGEYKSEDWVVPLELKKGKANASEIVSQLTAGATIAEGIVPKNLYVAFRPVAAYGGELKRAERDAFREKRHRVKFRQQRELVRLIRCGGSLDKAL